MRGSRTMTGDEQLKLWVAGQSIHNGDPGDEHSECCPDFSCCLPGNLAPFEVREAFAAADEDQRMRMLGQFLGTAIEIETDKKVYIAGIPDTSGGDQCLKP